MYNICLRYCISPDAAADSLQNGFIKVFKNLKQYNGEGELGAWIRKIIVRSSLDQLKINQNNFTEDLALSPEIESSEDPQLSFDTFDYDRLINLLNTLPIGYKMVFSMFVLDDMSHKEIAENLNISVATSRTQLLKARKQLKKNISKDPYLAKRYHSKLKSEMA